MPGDIAAKDRLACASGSTFATGVKTSLSGLSVNQIEARPNDAGRALMSNCGFTNEQFGKGPTQTTTPANRKTDAVNDYKESTPPRVCTKF
jgi:hypothetical protein